MEILLSKEFIDKYKRVDIRIRNKIDEVLICFRRNPTDLKLRNHQLRLPYSHARSIDIDFDYRAIYEEVAVAGEICAYFIIFGTHEELYK